MKASEHAFNLVMEQKDFIGSPRFLFMADKNEAKGTEVCNVKECGKPAERSVSGDSAIGAKLNVDEDLKRVHLCKDHYKQYKKSTKKDRLLENLGR